MMLRTTTLLLMGCLISSATAATIGLDAGNNTGYTSDGNNGHFIFLSTTPYNVGTDETVDTWQFTRSDLAPTPDAGAGVVPLIYTAAGGEFTTFAVGAEQTSDAAPHAWGVTLTAGVDYYIGFAQEDNVIAYSTTATPGTAIPMDHVWIFGDPTAVDNTDNTALTGPGLPSDPIPGNNTTGQHPFGTPELPLPDTYTFFNSTTLGAARQYNFQLNTTPVPEPSGALLGLLGLGLFLRRRR